MISKTGWRFAWMIAGSSIMVVGLLIKFTVVEPIKRDAILVGNKSNNNNLTNEAKKVINENNNKGFEVKEDKNKVVIKQKKKSLKDLAEDYKKHFGMMFKNTAAVILILASAFRLVHTIVL